ncbi:hypothetical protein MP228_010715 [Amoeboaphelidium protococcarum]|nr:hypothetical protein MP228_010715 [Amoeboaphelidium protococcarum]
MMKLMILNLAYGAMLVTSGHVNGQYSDTAYHTGVEDLPVDPDIIEISRENNLQLKRYGGDVEYNEFDFASEVTRDESRFADQRNLNDAVDQMAAAVTSNDLALFKQAWFSVKYDTWGQTLPVFLQACSQGRVEIVQFALSEQKPAGDRGVNIYLGRHNMDQCFERALQTGQSSILSLLLEYSEDLSLVFSIQTQKALRGNDARPIQFLYEAAYFRDNMLSSYISQVVKSPIHSTTLLDLMDVYPPQQYVFDLLWDKLKQELSLSLLSLLLNFPVSDEHVNVINEILNEELFRPLADAGKVAQIFKSIISRNILSTSDILQYFQLAVLGGNESLIFIIGQSPAVTRQDIRQIIQTLPKSKDSPRKILMKLLKTKPRRSLWQWWKDLKLRQRMKNWFSRAQ